jgi:hypothetical protein
MNKYTFFFTCRVTSRSQKNLQDLERTIGSQDHKANLILMQKNIADEVECMKLKDEILQKEGKIDHCIASIGSFWGKGPLSKQSVDEFKNVYGDTLLPHFLVYKTFANELEKQPKSSYTFITGGLGEACVLPNSSLVTVYASGLYGLYQAAATEHKNKKNFKVSEIRFYQWIRNRPDKDFDPIKSQMEVGTDWTANIVTKILQEHKGGLHKLLNRKKGDEFLRA